MQLIVTLKVHAQCAHAVADLAPNGFAKISKLLDVLLRFAMTLNRFKLPGFARAQICHCACAGYMHEL